jgi:NADPH:quinone reductase-like Zn-dependent oxidoreductase
MYAITQHTVGGPEVFEVSEVDDPQPGSGEVLIRVGAAGVNPVDGAVRGGYWPILGEPPFIVGWDVAGTVVSVGPDVTGFRAGDRVFGMPRFPKQAAAYAELVCAPAGELALTPKSLSDVEAAALPLAGLTAYQALVEVAGVDASQRVLIQAAAGGVGHLAVQLAKARGAHVTAVVSPAKADFVRSLGADEVADYTAGPFIADLAPMDVVLDPFGSPNTQQILGAVRPGGVVIALLDVDDDARSIAAGRGVRLERIFVYPSGAQLAELAALVTAGKLRPHVAATFPLQKAGDAHLALAARPAGKVVLIP